MLVVLTLLACLFAALGTAMQAFAALRERSRLDPEIRSALALHDLKTIDRPRWWHRARRREHRQALTDLARESPAEVAAYRRVREELWAWSLLCTAATLALFGAAFSQ